MATKKKRTVRGSFDRVRTPTRIDPESGITRQSFRDECDINKIVDTYARTGMINHIPKTPPIFGECPEQTLFEAACVQAQIRSSDEDAALNPSSDALRAPETDDQDETGTTPPVEPEKAAEAAPTATEDES